MSDLWFNIRIVYWFFQYGPRGFEFGDSKYWRERATRAWILPIWIFAFHPITMLKDKRLKGGEK